MNGHREWESPHTFYSPRQEPLNAPASWQRIVTSTILLILGYLILNYFDVWPSTIKRRTYELIIYLIPSQAIFALQSIMARFSTLSHEDLRFRRADFGNPEAKYDALRRMMGTGPFPQAIRRVRSLSGVDNILPMTKQIGPPGLGNWDNSCYQNSILQGLASLPAFRSYIDRSLEACDAIVTPAPTHRALQEILGRLSDASSTQHTVWTPAVLKSMDSWNQQDAQEYLTKVLDAVEREASRYAPTLQRRANPGLGSLSVTESKADETASLLERVSLDDTPSSSTQEKRRAHNEYSPGTLRRIRQRATSALVERCPVDGMLAQALECQTCGFSEGYTLTQFNCLTLNLGDHRGHCSIDDLLDDYTEAETVDGVECTECTKAASDKADREAAGSDSDAPQPSPKKRPRLKPVLRTKAKQITLGRLPKDLILHINRSIFDDYGNQRKNVSLVRFPEKLYIESKWCPPLDDGAQEQPFVATYELKCSVIHYGRHDNGHYIAYGKRGKDWYSFSDEQVQRVHEQEVLGSRNIFMLFYEMLDPELPARDDTEPVTIPTHRRVEAQDSSTSSSSDGDALSPPAPAAPIPTVPVLRTASGSIQGEGGPLDQATVVSAM